jgi:hypothetical protein
MEGWLLQFLTMSWGGPIGLGVFLAGLGVFFWGSAQAKNMMK